MLELWCGAGFAPDLFWDQTIATFNASMGGVAKRRQADVELAVAGAWWNNYFAREKRIGPLPKYLAKLRGNAKQSASELAAGFKAMSARGLDVKVKRVARNG
jgi:hypothetical protein